MNKYIFSIVSRCQSASKFRQLSNRTYDHDSSNLKKIKLRKRLTWAILFGGTFVFALYQKKRRRSEAISESSLLPKNELYKSKVLFYNYRGFVLPNFVMKNMDALKTFQCRESDIFVASFPKTGTTWLQEIMSCILLNHDLDTALNKGIEDRFPYLEFIYPGLSTIEKMEDPRLIKTHLPFSVLPPDILEKKPKIICVLRNPKDVTVSYFHFLRMFTMTNYVGKFEDFCHDVMKDRVPYGPIGKHYHDAWAHRDDPNVLIVFYEEFHEDICASIRKIAQFLGKNLTDAEVENIADHCSFTKMSKNPSVNYEYWDELGLRNKKEAKFMRKGEVGDWKNYFTEELSSDMNEWIERNFGKTDLNFTYNVKEIAD